MSKKSFLAFTLLFLVATSASFLTFSFKNKASADTLLRVETRKTTSGNNYTIIYQGTLKMDVSLIRPDKKDKSILLCIPAAYTDLTTLKVDGLFIDKGTVYNRNKVNTSLGGAIKIVNGAFEIFPSNKGKLLNDSLINLLINKKGSLFQQIQMIEKGKPARYKDVKEFQRRAIVKLKGNKTAVIESYEHITLSAFTKDLLELGAYDALYTDMGSWDEGWYKQNNEVITIGRIRSQTDKQCNWVVLKIN
ncbi:MAG: hypothetical protein K0S44_981 [Bacteroidetes bacterium]|jgi:hypothetical protein|nr:hypothetical protein [Bacteroidota bacterium]